LPEVQSKKFMAGKNAYMRYRVIDECLNNNMRRYSRKDLLEAVISKLSLQDLHPASIDKDIAFMKQEMNAPIEYNRLGGYYYYSDEFSLTQLRLNEEEEQSLILSISHLDILKSTKYGRSFKSLVERIVASAKTNLSPEIVEFESGHSDTGLNWFDTLYDCISEKKSIIITHTVYNQKPKEHLVSPYMIKEYKNRFYLVCRKHRNDVDEPIYCFGMDRITNIQHSKTPFIHTPGFKSSEYFKHSIGITRKMFEMPLSLVLKFTPKSIPYVLSKPLHSSQKIVKKTSTSLTINLSVYDSPELTMQLLSYGDSVKILSPKSYVETFHNIIQNMASVYSSKITTAAASKYKKNPKKSKSKKKIVPIAKIN